MPCLHFENHKFCKLIVLRLLHRFYWNFVIFKVCEGLSTTPHNIISLLWNIWQIWIIYSIKKIHTNHLKTNKCPFKYKKEVISWINTFENNLTYIWVSTKKWIGFLWYMHALNISLITSCLFGLTWISLINYFTITFLVACKKMSIFFFLIKSLYKVVLLS